MTVNVSELRSKLRDAADRAAREGRTCDASGSGEGAQFWAGRQGGLLAAMHLLEQCEDEMVAELEDELIGDRYGQGVNMSAVARLEEFARSAGGAVDMASGTVYSDAEGGL